MKKWILIGLAVLVSVVVAAAIFGKPGAVDVTKDYAGRGIFGRQFETKADFLIVQFAGSKEWDLATLGADMPRLDELPKAFPYRWGRQKIYGVLSQGSRFKIVGAMRSTSSTMGRDWFMVEIENEGPFKGKVVSTDSLEARDGGPIYNPKYAIELTTATEK